MFDTVRDVISRIAGPDTKVVIYDFVNPICNSAEGLSWHSSVVAYSDRSVFDFSYLLCSDTLYIDVR